MRRLLIVAVLAAACAAPVDPTVGVWTWKPNGAFPIEARFLPVYLFEPDGQVIAVNEGLASIERGAWRRDAAGRLFLRMDSEGAERPLRPEGEALAPGGLPGEVWAPPEPALFPLRDKEADAARARAVAYLRRNR